MSALRCMHETPCKGAAVDVKKGSLVAFRGWDEYPVAGTVGRVERIGPMPEGVGWTTGAAPIDVVWPGGGRGSYMPCDLEVVGVGDLVRVRWSGMVTAKVLKVSTPSGKARVSVIESTVPQSQRGYGAVREIVMTVEPWQVLRVVKRAEVAA